MATAEAHTPHATGHRRHAPLVEIVVPVYNEHAVLATSIRRLHSYLSEEFPFSWRIVIADNASTDDTLAIAQGLAEALPGVDVLHLAQKGRGREQNPRRTAGVGAPDAGRAGEDDPADLALVDGAREPGDAGPAL